MMMKLLLLLVISFTSLPTSCIAQEVVVDIDGGGVDNNNINTTTNATANNNKNATDGIIDGINTDNNNTDGNDNNIKNPLDPIVLPSPPLPRNPFADEKVLSLDLARETVLLAGRLAYQIASEADALELLPPAYTFHGFRDVGSTEVMILSSETNTTTGEPGKILVVFRGTDDTSDGDWATNVNIPKVPYGPPGKEIQATTVVEALDWLNGGIKNATISVKVHQGFNEVFSDNLYDYIVDLLNSDQLLGRRTSLEDDSSSVYYYNSTVHFMGHSLGGANAQLMGTYYAYLHPEIQTQITSLGAPRQGNLAFKVLAESLTNLVTWRMVFCNDIVPRVPNVKYYHAGHLMQYRCGTDDDDDDDDDVDAMDGNNNNHNNRNPVGAYYRHAGDPDQGHAGIPSSVWNVSPNAGAGLINDHLGPAYLGWLDSAAVIAALEVGRHIETNWTTTFVSTEEEEERLRRRRSRALLQADDTKQERKRQTNQNPVEMLQELKAQGAVQGLRGFPISHN